MLGLHNLTQETERPLIHSRISRRTSHGEGEGQASGAIDQPQIEPALLDLRRRIQNVACQRDQAADAGEDDSADSLNNQFNDLVEAYKARTGMLIDGNGNEYRDPSSGRRP